MAAPTAAFQQQHSLSEIACGYLLSSARVKGETAKHCVPAIVAAALTIADSLKAGGKILICGNGGSAADSQHLAAEFVSVLDKNRPRPAMAAIALTTDSSILTAITNDFGYDGVFERQVEALGRAGDVLLGISTSGNSENVVRAVRAAGNRRMHTIALTGLNAGRVGAVAELTITVPSSEVQHIQESHVAIEHLLCLLTETALSEEKK